jgi:hypothetical protein
MFKPNSKTLSKPQAAGVEGIHSKSRKPYEERRRWRVVLPKEILNSKYVVLTDFALSNMTSQGESIHRIVQPQLASVQELSADHLAAFSQAISNILSTEIAELTFAQILDSLPLIDVYLDKYVFRLNYKHPLRNHKVLSPGVLEEIRQYRASFDSTVLQVNAQVSMRYTVQTPITMPSELIPLIVDSSIPNCTSWVS